MSSGDCKLMNIMWSLLWDPESNFYLPKVIREGLDHPTFGIKIPPFNTVDTGSLPEITMFNEPVLGYMKLELTSTNLTQLDSVTKGDFACNDESSDVTTLNIGLGFSSLNFNGNYNVSAGGGIGGCAIAAGAAILGGRTMAEFGAREMLGDDPVVHNTDLALWYTEPLGESDNGQNLVGTYYLNKDPIYDLQQEDGGDNVLNQSMKLANVKQTADEVSVATNYYKDQRNDQALADADAPKIGTESQYSSGALPQAYILAMARQKVRQNEDPDGRYERLANDIIHFAGQIKWVNETHPGTMPVKDLMSIISEADPDTLNQYVMDQGPYPVMDVDNQKVVEHVMPAPQDVDAIKAAYRDHLAANAAAGDDVDGTFEDKNIVVSLSLTVDVTQEGEGLKAVCQSISAEVSNIEIVLKQSAGWWPGLYDKVTNWIANGFLNDTIKDKIGDAVDSQDVRDNISSLLTGALNSLIG